MEQVEDIERVLRDITKQSYVKSLDVTRSKDYEGNYTAKFQASEGVLSKLKTSYIAMEAKCLFLENLSKDPQNWPSVDEIEEHYTSMNADHNSEMKHLTEDLEAEIDEMADRLQTKQEQIKEKLQHMESKLTSVKEKKKEYELLKQKTEVHKRDMKEKEKTRKFQKELEEKQLQTDFAIKQCNGAIRSLEQCIDILKTEVNRLQGRADAAKHNLRQAETRKQQLDQERQEKNEWLQGTMELLQSLEGLTVKTIGDDSLVLEFLHQHITAESITPLLTLKFQLRDISPRLCGAEMNIASLEIDDLVCLAVEAGDVITLVHGVQTRLRNYQGLRQEIEQLQTNYALDWEPRQNRIRVMVGRSGKTICTLVIGSAYPDQGSITLISVESKDQHPENLDQLRPPSCSASLSEWILHLQDVFSTQ